MLMTLLHQCRMPAVQRAIVPQIVRMLSATPPIRKPVRVSKYVGEGKLRSKSIFSFHNGQWLQEHEEVPVEDGAPKGLARDSLAKATPIDVAIDKLVHFFLPAGYPGSVSSGYLKFCSLSVAAGTASSAAFVLSTQSLLYAVGLGAGSIPLVSFKCYPAVPTACRLMSAGSYTRLRQ